MTALRRDNPARAHALLPHLALRNRRYRLKLVADSSFSIRAILSHFFNAFGGLATLLLRVELSYPATELVYPTRPGLGVLT